MRSALLVLLVSCGGGPAGIYEECDEPAECELPEGVEGECVDKGDGEGGFCTWSCTEDEHCQEPTGEFGYVCSSFESSEGMHCFPSCEGVEDDPDACPRGWECRSTGGGSENRKICFPL